MYDKETNERAVKAYSHPGVGEYIPRRPSQRKKSLIDRIKAIFR
jgi:hypothetical protein